MFKFSIQYSVVIDDVRTPLTGLTVKLVKPGSNWASGISVPESGTSGYYEAEVDSGGYYEIWDDQDSAGAFSGKTVVLGTADAPALAAASVTAEKLATASVTTAKIEDGAVNSYKLAEACVTDDKIANEAIQPEHISENAVTEAKVASGSITPAKLADATKALFGVYNVTVQVPLETGYYTRATARAAVPAALRSRGMAICYETAAGVWTTEIFVGAVTTATANTGWTGTNTDKNWRNLEYPALYGEQFTIASKYIHKVSGAIINHADCNCTEYIPISRQHDILVRGYVQLASNMAILAYYDKDWQYISSISDYALSNTLITIAAASIPENACYVRAACKKTDGGFLAVDDLSSQVMKRVVEREWIVDELTGEHFSVSGYYINRFTGTAVVDALYACTDYVPIDGLHDLYVEGAIKTSHGCLIAYYDVNRTYLSGDSIISGYVNGEPKIIPAASIPATAKYVRATCLIASGGRLHANGIRNLNTREEAFRNELLSNDFDVDGYYIHKTTGVATAEATYSCTDYVPIDRLQDIIIKGNIFSTTGALLAYYDQNRVFISAVSTGYTTGDTKRITAASIPSTACYVRASCLTATGGILRTDSTQAISSRLDTVNLAKPSYLELATEQALSDEQYESLAELQEYKESLDSLLDLQTTEETPVEIEIAGLDKDLENYVQKVHIHYGAERGTPQADDVFMDGSCQKDFRDIRFLDEDGQQLDFKILSHGNYDFIRDSRLNPSGGTLQEVFMLTKGANAGKLVRLNIGNRDLEWSADAGVTWTVLNNATDYIMLCFVDSDDTIYTFYRDVYNEGTSEIMYALLASENFATPHEITDLTAFLRQKVTNPLDPLYPKQPAQRIHMQEDRLKTLYLAKYTNEADSEVWAKPYGQAWRSVFQTYDNHHVHDISIDRTGEENDVVYVGMDGSQAHPSRNIKSDDMFATYDDVIVAIDGYNDVGSDYPLLAFTDANGDQYRLGYGETNVFGGPAIYKTKDDVNFYPVLLNHCRALCMRKVNGIMFASVLASYDNKLAMIMVSYDDGETWTVGYSEEYHDCVSVGTNGTRFATDEIDPLNADAPHMIWSGNQPAIPLRIYNGGADDYFAIAYVKVGTLPTTGRTITCQGGYLVKAPSRTPFVNTMYDDDLLLQVKLNEGRGRYALETVSGTNLLLPIGCTWAGAGTVRYGSLYPFIHPVRSNGLRVPNGGQIYVAGSNILPNKNFTLTFWINAKITDNGANGDDAFFIGNPGGVHVYFDVASGSPYHHQPIVVVSDGAGNKTQLFAWDSVRNDNIPFMWNHIAIVVSNDAVPTVRAIINQCLQGTQTPITQASAWAPNPSVDETWLLGAQGFGSYTRNVADIRVYNHAMTMRELRDMFYGYQYAAVTEDD